MEEIFKTTSKTILQGPKEFLTLKEACAYLDISETWMYKLTHRNEIRYFKPNGKKIYFKREDLLEWISQKPIKSIQELKKEADEYIESRHARKIASKSN